MTKVPELRARLAREALNKTDLLLKLVAALDLDDDELQRRYMRAQDALSLLQPKEWRWGSKEQRADFRELAADAEFLTALQGVVASDLDVPIEWLGVLVTDGSDASIDALIPRFVSALDNRDERLDQLRKLSKHVAGTPAVRKMLAEITTTHDERNARSPALALGPTSGIGDVTELRFHGSLGSNERIRSAQLVRLNLRVDSRESTWFTCNASVSIEGTQRFITAKSLEKFGLPPCEPLRLTSWLTTIALRFEVTWAPFELRYSNLRGKKRRQLIAWLSGN
ncbi:MAG TPA: hypothetical protein VGG28_30500 [Kofleriaceae bacterium]